MVSDLEVSLAFWCGVLGFSIAYHRPDEKFAYLDLNGAQIMLCQRNGKWETGPLEAPLGRGVMFQVKTDDLPTLERRLRDGAWPIHTGPREVWRHTGDREGGQREVFVQDPDGYLIMMNTGLGERPLPS
ncbi:MAG: VOC family protein [Thalassobaculaceae bacterium]|nr:VOC family protein [Thalassobaculaceae bacterium]